MTEMRLDRETRDQLRDLARRTLEAYRRLNEAAACGAAGGAGGDPISEAGEVLQDVMSRLRRTGGTDRGNGSKVNGSDH